MSRRSPVGQEVGARAAETGGLTLGSDLTSGPKVPPMAPDTGELWCWWWVYPVRPPYPGGDALM
ncbi:unnamed protein product [Tetraodon nigroviridis]|uniref:(spotted green pufferfish) hypothetical protein n=1 Tax=Tetraodon nigroviridis TaxID=99883 RepID=Q4RY73_TETNG|nr:unnamed protein product [Tetraodon nigroviridis]